MRMKKLILFAAMAAIAVSCAKTSEVNPVSGQAIGFDTWADNLTKSTHAPFASGATFNVYGYKHMGDEATHTDVFNGDIVTLDANGAWNYNGIRFWDRTTDWYTFFAIAPSGLLPSSPAQTGLFVTNDISFDGKTGDVLVAKKKNIAKTNYGLTVNLDFVPQAALIDLKFKKAINLKEATLTVKKATLKNIQTKGKLTVSEYDGNASPVSVWSLAATPVTASFNNTHGVNSVALPESIAAGVDYGIGNSKFLINNLIVMPQELINGGQQLEIEYSINFSGETITHTRTIDLNLFDDSDVNQEAGRTEDAQNAGEFITAWEPGKHYTYYITINADIIVFNATISDWTDANAFHYIIN